MVHKAKKAQSGGSLDEIMAVYDELASLHNEPLTDHERQSVQEACAEELKTYQRRRIYSSPQESHQEKPYHGAR